MSALKISSNKIPKFEHVNSVLESTTGFSIVPVKWFIPEDLFFKFLSLRKFPSTCSIRTKDQMDYLEEPDIFHDLFGHIPLLVNPFFADFMQEFGKKGLESIEYGMLRYISALYWFTVEFGLIKTSKGLRIYVAGITSSKQESVYSLEFNVPFRVRFNLLRVMKTLYHTNELLSSLNKIDWKVFKEFLDDFVDIE